MRLCSPRRDGLSLIEVLVSMAVFLMSLVALMHLINTSTNLASQSQFRARCAQHCRSKMNELAAGSLGLEGVGESAIEDDPQFQYSIEVEPGAAQGLHHVTVRVRYMADAAYPIEVAMSRMMLDPSITGSTQDVPAAPAGSTPESMTESGTTSSSTTQSGGTTAAKTTTPTTGGTTAAKTSGTTAPTSGGTTTPTTSGTTAPKSGGTTTPQGGGTAPKGGTGTGTGSGAKGK